MLHGIHTIFPPPSVTGHTGGDPISLKKLQKGDAQWAYIKEVLGWTFDGQNFTIALAPQKIQQLEPLLRSIAKRKTVPLHTFQVMAGKLNHAAFGMPAGQGLTSPINAALQNNPSHIHITKRLKQAIKDWITLLQRI
jgi:hypothetical protein